MAPFSINFLRAALFRFVIEAVSKRSLSKAMQVLMTTVPRFGISVGLASVFFYLTMCLLRRIQKSAKVKVPKPLCAAFSALAFSMPLIFGLKKAEV